jgi:hypothetical protein
MAVENGFNIENLPNNATKKEIKRQNMLKNKSKTKLSAVKESNLN